MLTHLCLDLCLERPPAYIVLKSPNGNTTKLLPGIIIIKSLLPERLVTTRQATHLTRSIPSKASDSEAGSLVTTASLATQTPCSLAPISAPQSQDGLLSTTAWVFGTCSISIYVHCRESRNRKGKIIAVTLSNPVTEVTQDFNVQMGHTLF